MVVLLIVMQPFLFGNAFSQNLIRNGSFENFHTPINWNWWGGDFIGYYSNPADTVMIDWQAYQTPDFLTSACTHTFAGVPKNFFGYSHAKNGNAYTGFVVYARGGYDKEYIYQQLAQPLQAGKIYCLSFHVSRADRITYAIKNIGALFSNNLKPVTNGYEINALPQVENQNGFITDTAQWTLIQGCFTAAGGEQYITIGNFTTNFNTDTLNTHSTNLAPGRETTSYYYIDDITLIDQTTVGIKDNNELAVMNVYPNPAKDVLNIETNLQNKENLTVKITDVIGREVLLSEYKEQLDVSSLQKGIYFISILQGSKTISVKKIVKE